MWFDTEDQTVTTDGPERREQGIEFGDLEAALAAHEYPTTTAEVLDAYGEHELTIPNGTRTLREVLGPLDDGDTTETSYESPEEVRQMIFNAVGSDANIATASTKLLRKQSAGGKNRSDSAIVSHRRSRKRMTTDTTTRIKLPPTRLEENHCCHYERSTVTSVRRAQSLPGYFGPGDPGRAPRTRSISY